MANASSGHCRHTPARRIVILLCLMLIMLIMITPQPHKQTNCRHTPARRIMILLALLIPLRDYQTNKQTNRETNKQCCRHTPFRRIMILLCLMLLDVMITHKNKQTMPRPPRADSALLAPLCDDQTNNQTNRETNKHFTIRHTPAQISLLLSLYNCARPGALHFPLRYYRLTSTKFFEFS